MPTAADGYEMYNARFDNRGKDHDKYFTRHESGEYVLKDGYEERFLGSGDYVNSGGAISTFSNDYDDLWDSYEPDRDKKVYGIFKKPSSSSPAPSPSAPAPTPAAKAPAPKAKVPPTIEYSPEISQAKERVNKYQEDLLSGATSEAIYGKGNYLAEAKAKAGVASSPAKDTAEQAAQSFLDAKKYQFKAK